MKDDGFHILEGDNLFLIFTHDEFEKARFRGETIIHNRGIKSLILSSSSGVHVNEFSSAI